eukprot:TRINITY_DN25859_c0_g1_i4.p1 TRINITY_DN25859_c0_g1~~TRINITY_DN25859_c0_g1_i4.p1  ORF type:complete len:162 (+),score=22.07 TRINITY_DN25859_c0_g1_i4:197-682(+)
MSHPKYAAPVRRILTSHRVTINATPTTVFEHLLLKIRHPDRFVPGVTHVEIIQEFGEHSIERKMTLPNGKIAHEVIGAERSTLSVMFRLCPGCAFSGYVSNVVLPPHDNATSCDVDFTLNWVASEGVPDADFEATKMAMAGAIVNAVEQTKVVVEASLANK